MKRNWLDSAEIDDANEKILEVLESNDYEETGTQSFKSIKNKIEKKMKNIKNIIRKTNEKVQGFTGKGFQTYGDYENRPRVEWNEELDNSSFRAYDDEDEEAFNRLKAYLSDLAAKQEQDK